MKHATRVAMGTCSVSIGHWDAQGSIKGARGPRTRWALQNKGGMVPQNYGQRMSETLGNKEKVCQTARKSQCFISYSSLLWFSHYPLLGLSRLSIPLPVIPSILHLYINLSPMVNQVERQFWRTALFHVRNERGWGSDGNIGHRGWSRIL